LPETLSQHSGLLLERGWSQDGQPLFGFLHLTIQEYLAALWLFEQWIAFAMPVQHGRVKGAKRPQNPIYPFLFSPRWQEVILLAAARASDTSQTIATRFLQDVAGYRDRYEPILNRAVLAAGRILGDGLRVERDLAKAVCEGLTGSWFGGWGPTRKATSEVLSKLGKTGYVEFILGPIVARLNDETSEVRSAAAEALGFLKDPRALEPLLACLSDRGFRVREAAARALGTLEDPRALELIPALLVNKDPDIRWTAIWALRALNDPRAIEPLLSQLADRVWIVRRSAAEALGALKDPRALEPLLARLTDEEADERKAAAIPL
jgi:hypothetical protein